MSYFAKKKRSFFMRCFIRCQNLVMYSLIFTLMVLLAGLGLSIYYEELPVPDRLLQVINNQLEKQGLKLEFEKITLDFTGNVLVQDARVSFAKTQEPAVEIELLYLNINYASLILGKVPIEHLRIANARLYCPAVVSLSGTTDQLVEQVHLDLSRHWSRWQLDFLTAKFQHLDVVASGDLSALVAKIMKPRSKDSDQPELYLQYLNFSRMLSDYSKNLKCLEAPIFELKISSPSISELQVETSFLAECFVRENLPIVRNLKHHGVLQVLPEIMLRDPLSLTAESIEYEDLQLQVNQVALSAWKEQPIQNLDSAFPFEIKASTGKISAQGNSADQVLFKGQIRSLYEAEGTLIAGLYDGALHASLKGNWKEKTATGSLTGSLNLEQIVDRPELDHLWKLRWSKQHEPIYLDADFNYPGNLDDVTANFRVETRDIDIIKTPFQWARVRGTLHGTKLNVPHLEGGGHGNDLFCTFSQDIKKSPFYRFTMVGRFRPHDIDIWWRDWWKKTFDYLDIKGELPWMDMSIRNAFKYRKQLTLFGYAEGENVNLKGMHFDKASAKLFIRPNYIDALDIQLVRPEGQARGQFQRQLILSKLKSVVVDVTSNLDLQPSMELFGESGLRIIEPYTWEGNPTITLLGEFNFENNSHWQDLLFEVETDQPMTVYNFPFDSLDVEGHYDHGDTLLHNVTFDFAGGKGLGEASFLKQDDQSFLLFDLTVEDAELDEALKRIGEARITGNEAEIEEEDTKKNSEPLQGKLKVHASGISPAGYGLERVMAKGNIEITDGNLAQIPLFGPLSGLIPFTKLRLNEAKGYFAWDDGKMTFPDLKMTGKTARLEGIGDYYTSNSTLDFQVRVYLLREADIPLVSSIIMPLFDPFSQMAAVNLKGTLKKPEWRFAISPFNLFDGKTEAETSKVKEELLEFEFRK